jgi:DNA invertase Pin-like site-specific DNA recombinase
MEISPLRAAEYMRMSTEHQQYSIANQSAAIQEYANAHSIEIVRTYVDRGKSGLGLAGRHGLKELLGTVEAGAADFSVLLVYDVSRWGRFQDVDESAYHEYSLKRAGVSVIYCAEPFRDNGSPTDALLKTLKRTMAAEYSRELSVKVFEGQLRIAELGYRLGGAAGFGFRRMVLDPAGSRRTVLASGEHKTIQTDRVTLVHGPAEEVRAVRKVFDLFVNEDFSEARIAAYMTERGIMTRFGNPWVKKTIRDMLTNPKYAGDLVFNRTAAKLRSPPVN